MEGGGKCLISSVIADKLGRYASLAVLTCHGVRDLTYMYVYTIFECKGMTFF